MPPKYMQTNGCFVPEAKVFPVIINVCLGGVWLGAVIGLSPWSLRFPEFGRLPIHHLFFHQPATHYLNTPYPGLVAQRKIDRLLGVYGSGIVKLDVGVGLIDQHTDFSTAEDYTLDSL